MALRAECPDPRTVVVADDVDQVRTMVVRAIGRSSRLAVVGEAADFASAFAAIKAGRPDIAVIDCSMPGPDPVAALWWLRAAFPRTALVLLTGTPPEHLDAQLLRSVHAALHKCAPLDGMLEALEELELPERAGLSS